MTMLDAILPFIGWGYIRFVAATSRIIEHGKEIPDTLLQQGKVFIFSFWHGRQFFLVYVRRHDSIDVLISQSKDGEYIARIIGMFGPGSVRGSSSRGGSRALVKLKRSLAKGRIIAVTPDGPRGPARKVQQGVVYIARKMNVPIIPLAYAAKRCKIFHSWDEYHIPYPFNRIAVTYGEPYYIDAHASIDSAAQELEKRLNENTLLADTLSGRL